MVVKSVMHVQSCCFANQNILLFCRSRRPLLKRLPIGSFSNDDGDGNKSVKTAIGLLSKTTSLPAHHAFLYIYCRHCTTTT